MEIIQALEIKREADASILRKPNVVGTGIGFKNGDPKQGIALIANVAKKLPAGLKKGHVSAFSRVSPNYDGLQSDVQETGYFYAFADPTGRFRPIPAGVSIGHKNITAGTLGAWVNYNGQKVMLSNNHVLADSNNATIQDHILQPGDYDGGNDPNDHVADLAKFVKLHFEGEESDCDAINMIARAVNFCSRKLGRNSEVRTYVTDRAAENLVDCAIATPTLPTLIKDELINGEKINGWSDIALGEYCHKYGRTTGHTEGSIIQIDVTALVSYGTNKIAKFVGQLMAGAMSQGGDSGSAILNQLNSIVGLLFAGSTNTTIINPISEVINALGITI